MLRPPFPAPRPSAALLLAAVALMTPRPLPAQPVYTSYVFSVVAGGGAGGAGSADGTGAAAQFNDPRGIAVDGGGTLYVADSANDTIRKIAPGGVVTTLAGSPGQKGSADGTGSAARFNFPSAVAVDVYANVYVADAGNDTIRMITPAGVVSTIAGSPGLAGSADGTGGAARFNEPEGIAVDPSGVLYVADFQSGLIRRIAPGGAVTTLAGGGVFGYQDGTGPNALFSGPSGLALDG
jgi:sugar lactone lactonase YvrE